MNSEAIDPAPRAYPTLLTLLRRGRFNGAALPRTDAGSVERWLLSDALGEDDLLHLVEGFLWRLVAAGLPLERASLHVGTLHPQVYGYAWNWRRDDGLCDEVRVSPDVLATDAYRRNPLYRVIDHGKAYRARGELALARGDSPLLADLAAEGFSDYAALPLHAGGAYHNAMTVATRQGGGFADAEFATIDRLLKLFALHVERHMVEQIARNVVATYLGAAAGRRVLDGAIGRGSGAEIESIIWASDLRGFTRLAAGLNDRQTLAVLNAYFERLAGAVLDHGGDILKFIGDGLLAVFPLDAYSNDRAAAAAALDAAEAALSALADLNADRTALADISDWRPLRTGIALHRGAVFFGNLGAPERLDFTVIGQAVNTASRVESLTKTVGRPILITAAAAALLGDRVAPLGAYGLRGLDDPIAVFAPSATPGDA